MYMFLFVPARAMATSMDIDIQDLAEDHNGDLNPGPLFPLSRIKKIMKADKDIHMCSAEAVLLTTFAAVHLFFVLMCLLGF